MISKTPKINSATSEEPKTQKEEITNAASVRRHIWVIPHYIPIWKTSTPKVQMAIPLLHLMLEEVEDGQRRFLALVDYKVIVSMGFIVHTPILVRAISSNRWINKEGQYFQTLASKTSIRSTTCQKRNLKKKKVEILRIPSQTKPKTLFIKKNY